MDPKASWNMPAAYRDALALPERIGRFSIVGLLGSGGMGKVFAAQDMEWGEAVALKTIDNLGYRDPAELRAEFRRTAQLRHPNLVSLYELGCEENAWFFTMEWLRGDTLAGLDPRDPRLPRIIAELAAVVHAIHGQGLLHLDIKPSNVVMRGDSPVLLDFGIAQMLGARAGGPEPVMGTPGFIAPERLRGVHGVGADWFALGVTLSRILGAGVEDGPLWELARRWSEPEPERRGGWTDALRLVGARPIPFAERLRSSRPTRVGRTVEIAHIRAAWRERGGTRLVSLVGPSGVGKSSLAEIVARELAESDGACVVLVRCHPREPSAWRVVDAVLEGLGLPSRPPDGAELPVWARWAGVGAVDDVPHALATAVASAVLAKSHAGGLVLVVRDVQWADVDSARVLGSALSGVFEAPVMIAVTVTEGAAEEPEAPFVAELQHHLRLREVVMNPLPATEAAAWLAEAAPAMSEAEATEVAVWGRGLPFLWAQGVNGVPAVLADLTEAELDLLRTVAVAGMPLPLGLAVGSGHPGAHAVDTITRLEIRGLIVLEGLSAANLVTCRHALIREAVEAGLADAARRAVHQALASRAASSMSRAFLAYNLFGGGDQAAAAEMAREGAREANRRGAFLQAAQLWRLAAQARSEPGDGVELTNALLAAGHRAEAAEVILQERENESDRVEAAGHLLAAGAVDRGREVLRPVLFRLGIADPQSGASAMWRAVLALVHVAWLGPGGSVQPGAAERARASWLLARGLLATDAFVGMYFALVGLSWALRSPDIGLRARLAAVVGSVILGPVGGAFERWGAAMLSRANSESVGNPLLEGVVSVGRCQQALLAGDWDATLEAAERAADRLAGRGEDTSWELDIAELGAIRALEELGRYDEALRRAARLRHGGKTRGTLYTEVTGMLYEAGSLLHVGAIDAALHLAATARRLWTFDGFHMQHAYALRIEVTADLCHGNATAAYQALEAAWGELDASRMTQIPLVHFDMWELRARLSAAAGDLAGARRAVAELRRQPKPYSRAWASAIEAVCLRHSAPADAIAALESARMFGRADVVRFTLDGDPEPLRRRGVVNPEAWVRVQLPASASTAS